MSKTALSVLNILSSGDVCSGELIGKMLGVSRMAISKVIRALNQQGLNISSTPGKGYQLVSPVQLLDKQVIFSLLSESSKLNCSIEVLQQVESSSDYILAQPDERDINGLVCLAECQTSGRGRRQRGWHASPYRNVILSMGWCFDEGMSGISGLGIAAGITLVRALHEAGFAKDIGLKWPNDIVCNDRKLGGLLIDVRGEHYGPCQVVLGLGLNLFLSEEDQQKIDQVSIGLDQISSTPIDRNLLIADIINSLAELFETYSSSGFRYYHQSWRDFDCLYNRPVIVLRGDTTFSGVAKGVDESGALLLDEGKLNQGKQIYSRFYSGDVSLRLVG